MLNYQYFAILTGVRILLICRYMQVMTSILSGLPHIVRFRPSFKQKVYIPHIMLYFVGVVGARNVKWLACIEVHKNEYLAAEVLQGVPSLC